MEKKMTAKEMKEMKAPMKKEPVKKPARLVKGSPEAAAYMKALREKKAKK